MDEAILLAKLVGGGGGGDAAVKNLIERSGTSFTIPSDTTVIGTHAFHGFNTLTSIVVPSGVTEIEASAFYQCSGLTSIVLPSGLTTIGQSAFYYCTGVTGMTVPASVTSIGSGAFSIGSSFNKATVTMLGTTPPSIYSSTFWQWIEKIIVPYSADHSVLTAYQNATNWTTLSDILEEASAS